MSCSSRAQEFHDNLDGCALPGLHWQPLMSRLGVGRDCLRDVSVFAEPLGP